MIDLYTTTALQCSKRVTVNYSTSFSLGIKTLNPRFHDPIYAIYGFVRLTDEIVDTFHGYDKSNLLQSFREDTYRALDERISLNPILHSFQLTVHQYHIERELIDAFIKSMEMDLHQISYQQDGYEEYIYGSAEVVGLMCLKVFCEGNQQLFDELSPYARSLGSAFQKVNFLRDIESDYFERGRMYFPGVNFDSFDSGSKMAIEEDIQRDFQHALIGIKKLPQGARGGVYLAYIYYHQLFKKIRSLTPQRILTERIRVPDLRKILLLSQTLVLNRFNFML